MCTNSSDCSRCEFPNSFFNGTCQILGDGASGVLLPGTNQVVRCQIGCSVCTIDINKTINCITISNGFTLVQDVIIKCSLQCMTCKLGDINYC